MILNRRCLTILGVALLSIPAWGQDWVGVAELATNQYRILDAQQKERLSFSQNELSQVLLLPQASVVQDIFRRLWWWDAEGRPQLVEARGGEFKVAGNLLAAYSKGGFLQVYRAGATGAQRLFETHRPVQGVGLAANRFAYIDGWLKQLQLFEVSASTLSMDRPTRSWVGVRSAWLSQGFVGMQFESGTFQLIGQAGRMLPVDGNLGLQPDAFQLSDHLAVTKTTDGRVRVYRPDGLLLQRVGIQQVILTPEFLALRDAWGWEWFAGTTRAAGQSLGRTQSESREFASSTTLASWISSGLRLTRVVNEGSEGQPRFRLIQAWVSRAQQFILGDRQGLVWNPGGFEVLSLDAARFGQVLFRGQPTPDPAPQFTVGLNSVGWVNPTARNGQIFWSSANPNLPIPGPRPLDQMFVNRIDLPVDGRVLNYSRF